MTTKQIDDPVQAVLDLFRQAGHCSYGERVTALDHSLQTAKFARRDGASDAMIIAALLHDIGHMITNAGNDVSDHVNDDVHEDVGADYLSPWFVPEVVEPGRLHVAAKRYLCATDPVYAKALSPASVQTLALQGGPFDERECGAFEALPFWREALTLRRYDDMGKVPGMDVPVLAEYEPMLRRFLL